VLMLVFLVGSSMVIAGPAFAHDEMNPSTWTTEQDWTNLTDSQTGVTVNSGGSVDINENTTYTSNNITLNDYADAVGVNISVKEAGPQAYVTLYNASDGSYVGSTSMYTNTGHREVTNGVPSGDYYIEVEVSDDTDGTAESVTIDSIDADIQNNDPVLVRSQSSSEYRTEVGDNVTLDFSASFDSDGDNITYYVKPDSEQNWTQVDGETYTISKDSVGEYSYDVRAEDSHGTYDRPYESSDITITVVEDGSLTTDTDTGGSGTTGDSDGPLGFGIPIIVYVLVGGGIILVGVASIDE